MLSALQTLDSNRMFEELRIVGRIDYMLRGLQG